MKAMNYAVPCVLISFLLFSGCAKPNVDPLRPHQFIYIGNSRNPYAMFDTETGQACYAGPYLEPDERKNASAEIIGRIAALNPDGLFICERLNGMPHSPFK